MIIKRAFDGSIIEAVGVTPDDALTRPTVTIMRAASLAGVSRRTMYNWLATRKVIGIRNAGGNIRIFTDTLFTELGELPSRRKDVLLNEADGRV